MGDSDNGHTGDSSGRFLRIEEKLDTLINLNSAFQLDVVQRLARLEVSADEARKRLDTAVTAAKEELAEQAEEAREKVAAAAGTAREKVTDTASDRTYLWMRIGIGVSIALGVASIVWKLIGG